MGAAAMRPRTMALALTVFGLMAAQALGYTITIDGNVSDWGIEPKDYWHSDWDPLPGIYVNIGGSSEDYRPGTGGYIGPGWGGQDYDAEAFYFTADEQYAYFLIVTGVPPNGTCNRTPGDIAIDIGRDGTWDFGIETTGNEGNIVGALYSDVDWQGATIFPSSDPAYILGGTVAWEPDFASLFYSSIGYAHYVIEAAVPLAALPVSTSTVPFTGHWTMDCGNDEVDVEAELPAIPEPATSTMLYGGIIALAFARVKARKRKRKRDK